MPRTQVATVGVYEFGQSPTNAVAFSGNGPPITADSLRFSIKRGGPVQFSVEAYDADLSYTLQVSVDGVTWVNAVSSAGVSLASRTVVANGHDNHTLNLRTNQDLYLRLVASGGRGTFEPRGDSVFDLQKV